MENVMTKNYHAHGGNEWVIGGKLTFLPGATVEGGSGLFGETDPGFTPMPNQAASTATTIALLKDDLNALLSALKTAGLMAADTPAEENGDSVKESSQKGTPDVSQAAVGNRVARESLRM